MKELYKKRHLNCGLIGVIPHTGSFIQSMGSLERFNEDGKLIESNPLEEHVQPDGIQFMSVDRVKEIGKFDEKLIGDCQNADYAIHMVFNGYRNYLLGFNIEHLPTLFEDKAKKEDEKIFSEHGYNARVRLKKKWNLQKGWRQYDNVSVYDGWIGPDENGKYKIDETKTDNEY